MSYFDFDFDFDLLCGASVSSADSSATMSQDSSNFPATSSEEEPLTWESFNPPSAQPVSQTQTCDEQNNWTFYREQFNSTSAQPVSQTSAEPAAPVPAAHFDFEIEPDWPIETIRTAIGQVSQPALHALHKCLSLRQHPFQLKKKKR